MIDTKTRIKQHEGFVPSVYKDTLGFKTIGFGHLVTDKQKEVVESVIIEMCFNLGRPRVLKFKMFIQALNDKDFRKAADEMMDSRWAVQAKERAVVLSTMIRGL